MNIFSVEELIVNPSFINYCLRMNEDDIAFWNQYIQQYPNQIAQINEAKELIIMGSHLLTADHQKESEWLKIERKLFKKKTIIHRLLPYAAVAASFSIVLYIGYLVYQNNSINNNNQYIASTRIRKSFALPDSSFILLDKNAEVKLVDDFKKGRRLLTLKGAAYFKVAKDSLHPFSVQAGNYIVTALGTAFKMSYMNNRLEVMLEEGKVKVEKILNNKTSLISTLLPGDKLSVNTNINNEKAAIKTAFKPIELISWKTKDILFENTPLTEVIRQIELCYNVTISNNSTAFNHETFSGHFTNDSLDAILKILCFSINKQYQYKDSTSIIIHN